MNIVEKNHMEVNFVKGSHEKRMTNESRVKIKRIICGNERIR